MPQFKPLELGQFIELDGCFTEEYCLRGLSVRQIGEELGYKPFRMSQGIFIAFAIEFPSFDQFELGGWTKYSTDHFFDEDRKVKWSEHEFEETYYRKRIPISIEAAKIAWLKNMRSEKLIKVLPVVPHQDKTDYIPGGLASQIIVTSKIKCQLVKFLAVNEVFKDVWS